MVLGVSSEHDESGAPVAPPSEPLPPGYSGVHIGGTLAIARGDLLPAVLAVLREHGTLYGWAGSRGGARPRHSHELPTLYYHIEQLWARRL